MRKLQNPTLDDFPFDIKKRFKLGNKFFNLHYQFIATCLIKNDIPEFCKSSTF